MAWLIPIITAIIKALVPALLERTRPTYTVAEPDRRVRDRLRRRVRSSWTAPAVRLLVPIVLPLAIMGGCRPARTIYVPDGTPVRLRETIPAAKVWILEAGGRVSPGVMDLPEGWYCLPVSDED